MEIYSLVPDEQTREALRQLGEELGWETDNNTDGDDADGLAA